MPKYWRAFTEENNNMRNRLSAALLTILLSTSAHSADIALTVTTNICGSKGSPGISPEFIREIASEALSKKGYKIVSHYMNATGGLEARITVSHCQNFGSGQFEAYAASFTGEAVANGTSTMSRADRLVFSSHSGISAFGGDARNDQARKTRENLYSNIQQFIKSTF